MTIDDTRFLPPPPYPAVTMSRHEPRHSLRLRGEAAPIVEVPSVPRTNTAAPIEPPIKPPIEPPVTDPVTVTTATNPVTTATNPVTTATFQNVHATTVTATTKKPASATQPPMPIVNAATDTTIFNEGTYTDSAPHQNNSPVTIIPSSIPLFRAGDDNHSLASLQQSDVSSTTNSSGPSSSASLASKDPPGTKDLDPHINQYQTYISLHLKEAQTSLTQWTSRAVDSVKTKLTMELSKFYSLIHTMEKTVHDHTRTIHSHADEISFLHHKVEALTPGELEKIMIAKKIDDLKDLIKDEVTQEFTQEHNRLQLTIEIMSKELKLLQDKHNHILAEHASQIGDTQAITHSLVAKLAIVDQTLDLNKQTVDNLSQQLGNLPAQSTPKRPTPQKSSNNPFDIFSPPSEIPRSELHTVTPAPMPIPPNPQPQQLSMKPEPTRDKQVGIDFTSWFDHSAISKAPTLPPFNPKHSFKKWQSLCILELSTSKSSYYKSFTTLDASGRRILNPELDRDKRADLFALLNKAMKPENLEFLDFSVIGRSDGLELWQLCESRYAPSEKSAYEKKQLEREFENMKKAPNESADNFLKRVETQAANLATYKIFPTEQDKALTLLKGLHSTKLEAPILSVTYQDSNYNIWVKPGDLRHTLEKAKSLIYHKSEIEKSYKPLLPYADKVQVQGTPPATLTGTGVSLPSQPRPPNPNITQFKLEMSAQNTLQTQIDKLFEWKAKERDGCGIHPGFRHKFFNCFDLCRLCNDHGWTNALNEAKMRNTQRASRAPAGEEASTKFTATLAAKKATLQPPSSTPHTGDDVSTDGDSQNTNSTMADE